MCLFVWPFMWPYVWPFMWPFVWPFMWLFMWLLSPLDERAASAVARAPPGALSMWMPMSVGPLPTITCGAAAGPPEREPHGQDRGG